MLEKPKPVDSTVRMRCEKPNATQYRRICYQEHIDITDSESITIVGAARCTCTEFIRQKSSRPEKLPSCNFLRDIGTSLHRRHFLTPSWALMTSTIEN